MLPDERDEETTRQRLKNPNPSSQIPDPRSKIPDLGSQILNVKHFTHPLKIFSILWLALLGPHFSLVSCETDQPLIVRVASLSCILAFGVLTITVGAAIGRFSKGTYSRWCVLFILESTTAWTLIICPSQM